jgi:hypothetical protein
MSSITYIKKSVRTHHKKNVASSPNFNWVIGLTNNPTRRFNEHKGQIGHIPRFWRIWTCDNLSEAQYLEKYFKGLGYNAELGGTATDSIYLYMYYLPRNKDSKKKKKSESI